MQSFRRIVHAITPQILCMDLSLSFLMTLLQPRRSVFCEKPWHDPTFCLDLVPCFETCTITELDVACERKACAFSTRQITYSITQRLSNHSSYIHQCHAHQRHT